MKPPMGPGGPPPMPGRPRPGQPSPIPGKNMRSDDLFVEEFDMNQMEKESEDMLRMNYLTSDNAVFTRTSGGFLNLVFEDVTYPRVQVIRTFPYSNPDIYLSIREDTEKAREIGIIKNYKKDFPANICKLIEEQLNIRYFSPLIEHIVQVKEEGGYAYFDVITNYGECQFSFRSNSSSVVHLTETRLIIYDMDNNRFEIPDTTKLSNNELKKLDLFM